MSSREEEQRKGEHWGPQTEAMMGEDTSRCPAAEMRKGEVRRNGAFYLFRPKHGPEGALQVSPDLAASKQGLFFYFCPLQDSTCPTVQKNITDLISVKERPKRP